jgi:hypothetical protein
MRGVFGASAIAVRTVPLSLLKRMLHLVAHDEVFCDFYEKRFKAEGKCDCPQNICFNLNEMREIVSFNRNKCLAGGWRGHTFERLWPDIFCGETCVPFSKGVNPCRTTAIRDDWPEEYWTKLQEGWDLSDADWANAKRVLKIDGAQYMAWGVGNDYMVGVRDVTRLCGRHAFTASDPPRLWEHGESPQKLARAPPKPCCDTGYRGVQNGPWSREWWHKYWNERYNVTKDAAKEECTNCSTEQENALIIREFWKVGGLPCEMAFPIGSPQGSAPPLLSPN